MELLALSPPATKLIERARQYMSPDEVEIVVYHHNCSDGFSAAYCCWKRFGDNVQYLKGDYKNPLDIKQLAGKNVLLVDFSFPRNVYLEAKETCKKLMILDHHKSALIAMLKEQPKLVANKEVNVICDDYASVVLRQKDEVDQFGELFDNCFFDMNRSGCGLAWDYFFGNQPMPEFLKRVQDRDLWKFEYPDTKAFTSVLYGVGFQFLTYDTFLNPIVFDDAVTTGTIILYHINQNVSKDSKDSAYRYLDGHKIRVLNARNNISELGEKLCQDDPTIPFSAVFYWSGENNLWSISLRSINRMDTGQIAKKYGGGGHPNASGFTYTGNISDLFKIEP
jgi:oligoribonuclease NrnB/cAMP/cGMP phosphodiesterase (DHH superfamily)